MLISSAFFSRQAWLAAATCFLSSLFFIQSLVASRWSFVRLIVTEPSRTLAQSQLRSLARFLLCSLKLSKFRHRGGGGILPLAAFLPSLGLRDVVILSH